MAEAVITPKMRVVYANVITPQTVEKERDGVKKEEQEYNMVGVFAVGADLKVLKAQCHAALVEELGADQSKWPPNLRSPFRQCEERIKEGVMPAGYEAGAIFISMKSKHRPGLVDGNLQPIIDPVEFYRGCYALAQVRPYFYNAKGNKGVAFSLDNVQKIGDGDPLSGRSKPEDVFVAVAGATEDAGGIF